MDECALGMFRDVNVEDERCFVDLGGMPWREEDVQ